MRATVSKGVGYNVDTPDRLLDAAERLFAGEHYEKVTFAQIAAEAGASVGQIVYHFGRKDELVRAVILRRANVLNADRMALLGSYEQLVGPDRMEIRPLVRAFLDPYFSRLKNDDVQWRCFATFVGRSVWDGKLSGWMSESFDECAELYLAAFRKAAPGLSRPQAVRGFQFLLSVMHSANSDDKRMNALLGKTGAPVDYEAYHAALVDFVAGGFAALG